MRRPTTTYLRMTKRNSVLLLCLLCFNAFSQEDNSKYRQRLTLDLGISACSDISFYGSYNDMSVLFAPTVGLTYSTKLSGIHWLITGIGYYQVGDVYNYYTGRNYAKTDVRIFVNTVKIPLLYSIQFDTKKTTDFLLSAGPSFDIAIGESVIIPKEPLYNPIGFRNNVTQGKVEKHYFKLLNINAGMTFRSKKGKTNYLELVYYGTVKNLYRASSYGRGESSYRSVALKLGILLFNK